jgi:hypothetical protein
MIVKIYIKRGKNKKSRGRATTSNSNIEKKRATSKKLYATNSQDLYRNGQKQKE